MVGIAMDIEREIEGEHGIQYASVGGKRKES